MVIIRNGSGCGIFQPALRITGAVDNTLLMSRRTLILWFSCLDIIDKALFHGIPPDRSYLGKHLLISFLCRLCRCQVLRIFWFGKRCVLSHLLHTESCLVTDKLPVIRCWLSLHHIPFYIPERRTCQRLSLTCSRQFNEIVVRRMGRTGLIVVAYEVTLMRAPLSCLVLTPITGVLTSPVEVHIINILHEDVLIDTGIGGTVKAGATTVIAHEQVMMERGR